MKARRKKPTTDAVSAARKILTDFFLTYSLGKQDELTALLIATLSNLDESPAISRNRRLEAIKYLNSLSDALISARLVTESEFLDRIFAMDPPDDERVQEICEKIAELSKPIRQVATDDGWTASRMEDVSGMMAQHILANKDEYLATDAVRNFFLRYSLQESIELFSGLAVNSFTAEDIVNGNKKELLDYYRALTQLLVVTYLQSMERCKEFHQVEEGVGRE